MFYAAQLVSRDGPLQVLWVAATLDRQLNRKLVDDTAISRVVELYLAPDAPAGIFSSGPAPQLPGGPQAGRKQKAGGRGRDGRAAEAPGDSAPLALRLSGQLLLGVCRIYSRKVAYLLQDCEKALLVLKNICPTDAPLAFGDVDGEEGDGAGQEGEHVGRQQRTRHHHDDGDGRRGGARSRRRTLAAGEGGAGGGGLRVGLYDEDEELLAVGGSQNLSDLVRAGSGGGGGGSGELQLHRSGSLGLSLLGEQRSEGLDSLLLATPLGGGASASAWDPLTSRRGRHNPWSTDPHAAAHDDDDRHAYFDDAIPDHFEFDLDEHEIEALRAASQDLGPLRNPQPTGAAPGPDPFSTPQQPPNPSRLQSPADDQRHGQGGGGGAGPAPAGGLLGSDEGGRLDSGTQDGDVDLDGPGAEAVPGTPPPQQQRSSQRSPQPDSEEGHLAEGGEAAPGLAAVGDDDAVEAAEAPADDGAYDMDVVDADAPAAAEAEALTEEEATSDLTTLSAGGGGSTATPATAAAVRVEEEGGVDGVSDSVAGGAGGSNTQTDPETLPGNGTGAAAAAGGDGGGSAGAEPAAAAAAAATPKRARKVSLAPSAAAAAAGGGSDRPPARTSVCVDLEKDGRLRTTLPTHAVRELLQDRAPLIDQRRRAALRRRAATPAGAAAADGSPWLASWGRLLHPHDGAAAARRSPYSSGAAAGGGGGFEVVHLYERSLRHSQQQQQQQLGPDGRPLDVAGGPAALPGGELAPQLRHLFRFLAGRAGRDYLEQMPGALQGGGGGGGGGSAAAAEADGGPGAAVRERLGKRGAAAAAAARSQSQGEGGGAGLGGGDGPEGPGAEGAEGQRPETSRGGAQKSRSQAVSAAAAEEEPSSSGADGIGGGGGGGGSISGRSGGSGGGGGTASEDLVDPAAELPDLDVDMADMAGEDFQTPGDTPGGSNGTVGGGSLSGRGGAGGAAAEGERPDDEDEEEEQKEEGIRTEDPSEFRMDGAWGDEEGEEAEGAERLAEGQEGQGRRRTASDGFTARTQAVLRRLQVMMAAAARQQQRGSAKRRRLAEAATVEAAAAGGDGVLQVTTAAELLLAVADIADPTAAARKTPAAAAAARATANGATDPRVIRDAAASPAPSRVSRMAAARTFYDLLVLSNRGYISLRTESHGSPQTQSQTQMSQGSVGNAADDGAAATVSGAAAGGSRAGSRAASSTRRWSSAAAASAGVFSPGHSTGGGCSCTSAEDLVVVARRRLEAA